LNQQWSVRGVNRLVGNSLLKTIAFGAIAGALSREESRGSHFRTDFPKRDDMN